MGEKKAVDVTMEFRPEDPEDSINIVLSRPGGELSYEAEAEGKNRLYILALINSIDLAEFDPSGDGGDDFRIDDTLY